METLPKRDWPRLFPDGPVGDEREVRSRLGGLRFTQHEDARLHFEMSAPLGWRWRPSAEVVGAPGLLVSLVQGGADSGEIRVSVDDVPRELAPAEWAMIRLEERGHALWAKREEVTPIGAVADLLTRAEGPDGGVIARTNMAKDGPRIFLVTCQARADEYPAWAGLFYIALATFKLQNPGKVALAEPLAAYSCLHPAVIGFSYPASWEVAEETLTETHCHVRLEDMQGDRPAGSITVLARSNAGKGRLVSEHVERLKQSGVVVGEVPALAPSPAPAPELFTAASVLQATGQSAEGEVDVRVMVLEGESGALLLGVHGPTRSRSAVARAVHQRAFEIVRDTAYAV
jgi:hypothetical protein